MKGRWWDRRAVAAGLAAILALLCVHAPVAATPLHAGPDGAPAELATWRREGLTPFMQQGGPRADVAIDSATGVVWIIEGARVRALTWGPKGSLRHLGSTPPLWPAPTRILASHGHVVAWGWTSPLWFVDGRDPSWPRAVSRIEPGATVRAVAFDGARVLVAVKEDLVFYEVDDRSAPREVARSSVLSHQGLPVRVRGVAVDGAKVAVITFSGELVIFERDAGAARLDEVARMGIDYFEGIAFENGRIALEGVEGVLLIEVDEERGSLATQGSVHRMDAESRVVASSLHAHVLHIVERNYLSSVGIVRSFDVRRPATPIGLWAWLPGDASRFDHSAPFAASADTLALLSSRDRLHLRRRAADGRWLAPESLAATAHGQGALAALGPYVLSPDDAGGMVILVEEARGLRPVGRWPAVAGLESGADATPAPKIKRLVVDPERSLAVAVASNSDSSFHLLDLSDVRAPRELVRMGASTRFTAAAFVGGLVVFAGHAGLLVDRLDLERGLILEGVLFVEEAVGSPVAALTSIGSTVWMAQAPFGTGTGRLVGVDVSRPAEPTLRGRLALGDVPVDMVASGSLLFVLAGGNPSTLLIVDAADPERPWVRGALDVGSDPMGEGTLGMTAAGQVVVASPDRGLLLIDSRVPEHPDEVAWLEIPGGARSVATMGDRMWVGTRSLGWVGVRPARPFAARVALPWLGGGGR